jgi:hypothetical protein
MGLVLIIPAGDTLSLMKLAYILPHAGVLIDLGSYSAVRNMCSLAGILNGSEITIFLDDSSGNHLAGSRGSSRGEYE